MLFDKLTYCSRRAEVREKVERGLIVLLGNNNAPCNYPANGYTFRQDSSFLYFTGQERDALALVIDADSGEEWLLGDDIDIEDIIWTGFVPSVADLAAECGIQKSAPYGKLAEMVADARKLGREVHFLPPYRHDHMILLSDMLGIHPLKTRAAASVKLIKAVVDMRSIKSDAEIAEIERAMAIGYQMHCAAMKACRPGRGRNPSGSCIGESRRGSGPESPPAPSCRWRGSSGSAAGR